MIKNMKLILVLIIISCNAFQGSNLLSRHLAESISIAFEGADNLIFGGDSKWKFDIHYSVDSTKLSRGSSYTISILYKGSQAYASCTVASDVLLNCVVNESNQAKSDLIQINNVINDATIELKNLSDVYNIPIISTLNYEDSYSLTYDSTNYIWEFRVKLLEQDILPENGVVTIDLTYTSSDKVLANCVHENHILTCKFNLRRPQNYLFKISKTKYSGSISWGNLQADNNKELTIPIASKINRYTTGGSKELELLDGQWNYKLPARTEEKIYSASTLITINSKIIKKNSEEPLYYFTRCYAANNDPNNAEYNCKVIGDNQEITDLVSVSTSTVNNISIDWNNVLKADEIISRKAELSLIKLYDLSYTNTKKWEFKIDVTDDENLPENAVVWVTLKSYPIVQWRYKPCSFQAHVLFCAGGSDSSSSNTLQRLQTQKQGESIGSVTWKNMKQLHIDIPLNYTFTSFNNAYGGFFTDKWHFMINAKYKDTCPINSKVIIDILQNDKETTASCTLLQQNSNTNGKLHCISDYPTQNKNDKIKICPTKKYGSIIWNGGITNDNNSVEESTPISSETDTQINIVNNEFEAIDMYFSNNQWFFNIIARSRTSLEENIYNVDISVNGAENTAHCFLYHSTENANLRFICKCTHNNQKKDDLITLVYKEPDNTPSIKWLNTFNQNYPITLNTSLQFKKVDNFKKEKDYWTFDITLKNDANAILPINSKVLVDILDEYSQDWYIADCKADSKTLLSCVSNARTSQQPKLCYAKSLDSSVNWKNENREDYTSLQSTDDPDPNEGKGDKDNNSSNCFGDIKLYFLFILILVIIILFFIFN